MGEQIVTAQHKEEREAEETFLGFDASALCEAPRKREPFSLLFPPPLVVPRHAASTV